MATRGRLVSGRFAPVPAEALSAPDAWSEHLQIYEVKAVLTQKMSSSEEELAADAMWTRFSLEGCKLLGVEAKNNVLRLQVVANAFPFIALFAIIPALVGGIGLIIQYLTLNRFLGMVPSWTWTVLLLAGGAALVLYALSLTLRPREVRVPEWMASRMYGRR